VAFKAGALVEAVTKKLREQRFVLAEGNDAVPDVAGREHVEFFAQAPAGSAVVADRDDGTKVTNDR
jgi:hypothetical protein